MADPIVARNLTVTHHALDSSLPCHTLHLEGPEGLLYALTGKVRVYVHGTFLGTIGGRTAITEPLAHVVRFPARVEATVSLVLDGFSADYLIATCEAPANTATTLPYLHFNDAFPHTVGSGTHQRTVVEVPTPLGFALSVGETLNSIGGTSSWPAHASPGDMEAYCNGRTTWEESMFFVAPEPGMVSMCGFDRERKYIEEIVPIVNGQTMEMVLGSHTITAHPSAWLYYAWVYLGTALRKEYRKRSTDVLTYRK